MTSPFLAARTILANTDSIFSASKTATESMDVDDVPVGKVSAMHGQGPEVVDLEEKRRLECLADMEKIEREFQDLKEKFYREKIEQINKELEAIQNGTNLFRKHFYSTYFYVSS